MSVTHQDEPHSRVLPAKTKLMVLSPMGERLGEGVMEKAIFGLTPSPNLSPKGERNLNRERGKGSAGARTASEFQVPRMGELARIEFLMPGGRRGGCHGRRSLVPIFVVQSNTRKYLTYT
jgi:hypothetical protein